VSVPWLGIRIPLEGAPVIQVHCESFEDELRLGAELCQRDSLAEIRILLEPLLELFDGRGSS
jgi:hypothetical protein